jgi:hypothetical protein
MLAIVTSATAAPLSPKAAIQATLDRADQAFMKKDVRGTESQRTDPFKSTDQRGITTVTSRAQLEADLRSLLANSTPVKYVSKVVKVMSNGNKATAIITESVEIVAAKPHSRDVSDEVIIGKYSTTWVNAHGTWSESASKTITRSVLVDGRPLDDPDTGN